MTRAELLESTLRKRAVLLQGNPKLRRFQEELETILDKTISDENRMETVGLFLHSAWTDLNQSALSDLFESIGKLEKITKKAISDK